MKKTSNNKADDAQWLSISAAERATGISKHTLRIWERRYGFPQPLRNASGRRVYPPEQIQRLREIKRLRDSGFRPSKIIAGTKRAGLTLESAEPNRIGKARRKPRQLRGSKRSSRA
jgi:MerR family transcriptional regulator, light-induced transcriptional regulator